MSVLTISANNDGATDVTAAVFAAAQKDDLVFPKGRYLFDPPSRDADGLARVTLTAAFCEIQAGAVFITGGPHVRVIINAPLHIAQRWMQCFDIDRGGYILPGPHGLIDAFTDRMFGAVGDGATIETARIRALVAACFGPPELPNSVERSALNRRMEVGPGIFPIDETVLLNRLCDAEIETAGQVKTKFVAVRPNTSIFRTNGLAYSKIRNLSLTTQAPQDESAPLFDCNFDGASGTAALQNNTFEKLSIDCADLADVGFWYARSGHMGSETQFLQPSIHRSRRAAYRQTCYNALNNLISGGNFEGNRTHTIHVAAGCCHVINCGFQNQGDGTSAYQLDTRGFDIVYGNSASDVSYIAGCRSESWKFLSAGPYYTVHATAITVNPGGLKRWSRGTAFPLSALVTGVDTGQNGRGDGMLYRLVRSTGSGKSGATEPTWLGRGTSEGGPPGRVTDGDLVWEHIEYEVVSTRAGSLTDCIFPLGRIDCAAANLPLKLENIIASRVDWMPWQAFALSEASHRYLAVHVLKGAIGSATNAPLAPYCPTEIGADPASSRRARVLNFGSYSVLFSQGLKGFVKPDVGIERSQDQLEIIGRPRDFPPQAP